MGKRSWLVTIGPGLGFARPTRDIPSATNNNTENIQLTSRLNINTGILGPNVSGREEALSTDSFPDEGAMGYGSGHAGG